MEKRKDQITVRRWLVPRQREAPPADHVSTEEAQRQKITEKMQCFRFIPRELQDK